MDLAATDEIERRSASVAANQCRYPLQLQMAGDRGCSDPDIDNETHSDLLAHPLLTVGLLAAVQEPTQGEIGGNAVYIANATMFVDWFCLQSPIVSTPPIDQI